MKLFLLSTWLIVCPWLTFAKNDTQIFTSESQKFRFEKLLNQKTIVWGFDFLPDNRIIFTERNGALRIFDPNNKLTTDVLGIPKVWAQGQGGLLDVRVHPKIRNKIYICFSAPEKDEASTAVGTATLQGSNLIEFKRIFVGNNLNDESIHFGCRIEFDESGHFYLSLGDRNARDRVQGLEFHNGKILRLNDDGSVPADNPFVKQAKAKPEIWSFGHRNPQGLVRDPITGHLWSAEMGPRGGDELNLIIPGANYGWPVITYGREYYGPKIGEGKQKAGMEQPVAFWVPSISPSGITIYNREVFPKWKGNIFLGNLSGSHLRRLVLEGTKVIKQEELLKELDLRIRNVRTGPDGFLYLSTDNGFIARLVPVN